MGNLDDEGKICIVEMMCTRVLGDPSRCDALSKPHRLLEQYKGHVRYASRLRPCM